MKVRRHVDEIENRVLFMFAESNFPVGFNGKSKRHLDFWNNYCCLSTCSFRLPLVIWKLVPYVIRFLAIYCVWVFISRARDMVLWMATLGCSLVHHLTDF